MRYRARLGLGAIWSGCGEGRDRVAAARVRSDGRPGCVRRSRAGRTSTACCCRLGVLRHAVSAQAVLLDGATRKRTRGKFRLSVSGIYGLRCRPFVPRRLEDRSPMTIESIDAAAETRGTARRTPGAAWPSRTSTLLSSARGWRVCPRPIISLRLGFESSFSRLAPELAGWPGRSRSGTNASRPTTTTFPSGSRDAKPAGTSRARRRSRMHLGRMGVLSRGRAFPFDTLVDLLRFPSCPGAIDCASGSRHS